MILQYKASSGNVYELNTKSSILTRDANYHTWSWTVNGTDLQYGKRIANFSRDAAVYSTTLTFTGNPLKRKANIENLHEDFELDVRNHTPGRIIWGDYYIDCYITMSKTSPDDRPIWTDNDISIYCPYPFWIKEETKTFMPDVAPVGQTFLDYEFDYEYDYYYAPGTATWTRSFPFPAEFQLTIFGPCADPRVLIDGYPYQFFDTLTSTEYAVIDSRKNTVIKYNANGTQTNIFDLRNKSESVFQQIPGGTLTFNWAGTFGFDLTIYQERSEPRWS